MIPSTIQHKSPRSQVSLCVCVCVCVCVCSGAGGYQIHSPSFLFESLRIQSMHTLDDSQNLGVQPTAGKEMVSYFYLLTYQNLSIRNIHLGLTREDWKGSLPPDFHRVQ